jgi:hypothetical protein
MVVVAELDVKKDARNRITLPAIADFEHYHVIAFDDGHVELYPRVLADPLISMRTLEMMDSAMANLALGNVSKPVSGDAMLAALATHPPVEPR